MCPPDPKCACHPLHKYRRGALCYKSPNTLWGPKPMCMRREGFGLQVDSKNLLFLLLVVVLLLFVMRN